MVTICYSMETFFCAFTYYTLGGVVLEQCTITVTCSKSLCATLSSFHPYSRGLSRRQIQTTFSPSFTFTTKRSLVSGTRMRFKMVYLAPILLLVNLADANLEWNRFGSLTHLNFLKPSAKRDGHVMV